MHRVDANGKKPLGAAPQQERPGKLVTLLESRLGRLAIASVAVWTLSCGGEGSEPVVHVASVTLSPSGVVSMGIGSTRQLTATPLDAAGSPLLGRQVAWTTSNTAIASVSATGLVTATGGGIATITATSEGKSGTAVVAVNLPPPAGILTGIHDAASFVNLCPTSDTVYATLVRDFRMLSEGQPDTVPVVCTDPYPTTHLTDEVLNYQTLRMVYYMAKGTTNQLPWTSMNLYDWMKSQIAGVDFHASGGVSSCCEIINGKKYISLARKDSSALSGYRDWFGVANWLALLAHETRHAAGYPHVTGCPAFPLATDSAGCDPTYDINDLGAYGIQYWLFRGWAIGGINVGIACAPPTTAQAMAQNAASAANVYLPRFVQNAPESVTALPNGGGCYSQ
jgi:hypothetical protein